jgi:thiosulfate reductase cytochrome b subunit
VSRVPLIRFGEETVLSEGFYDALLLDRKLARGMAFHFSFGWLFLINDLPYVLYLAARCFTLLRAADETPRAGLG